MRSAGFKKSMKDKGIVISADSDFARVEVDCLSACNACAASILCTKNDQSTGLLSVRNTLRANPGDTVTIDVPDTTYSKALIVLFSILLGGCLAGLILGYLAASIWKFGLAESSLFGLILGMLAAGFWLTRRFRKIDNTKLYPVITAIQDKGDHYE